VFSAQSDNSPGRPLQTAAWQNKILLTDHKHDMIVFLFTTGIPKAVKTYR